MNTTPQQHPIFMNKYNIKSSCGEGNTSKVYLAEELDYPHKVVAIKILKEEFLRRDSESIISVNNEIKILKNIKHKGIVDMLEFGDNGLVVKPSTRRIENLVYIIMEYIKGGLLFDLC